MQLGILADIHEDVPKLSLALHHFRQQGVEQVVLLGDIFDMGRHLHETVGLLVEARVVGVWGNHQGERSPDCAVYLVGVDGQRDID
jgi:predicted phosphodiesterase